MTREHAEHIAIQALTCIAGEPDQLDRFFALSGLDPILIRAAAAEPGFLIGVLDHVMGEETLLLAVAQHAGIEPADIGQAREALGGRKRQRDLP